MLENNKLIAEFLGWEVSESEVKIPYQMVNEQIRLLPMEDLKYQADLSDLVFQYDWNWLMLVVDKIESIVLPTLNIDLGYRECEFDNASFVMYISPLEVVIDIFGDMQREEKFIVAEDSKDKLTNTFEACVKFIKWYNEKR